MPVWLPMTSWPTRRWSGRSAGLGGPSACSVRGLVTLSITKWVSTNLLVSHAMARGPDVALGKGVILWRPTAPFCRHRKRPR